MMIKMRSAPVAFCVHFRNLLHHYPDFSSSEIAPLAGVELRPAK
jgi:hypothetical protein